MAAAVRARIIAVAAKLETTQGTDASPTLTANAVRPIGIPMLTINYLESGDRKDEQFGGLGDIGNNAMIGRYGQIDITLSLKGASADYSTSAPGGGVVPEFDAFLQSAGFVNTTTGASGAGQIVYTTLDNGNFPTMTLYLYGYNKLYRMVGCVTAPKIKMTATKRAEITFTCIGQILTNPIEQTLGSQTLLNNTAPMFEAASLSMGSLTSTSTPGLVCRSLAFDLGTVHTARPSAGAVDGHAGYFVTDRMVKATLEMEVIPLSTYDPYEETKAGWGGPGTAPTTGLNMTLGSVQFNTIQVITGQFQFMPPKHTNGSGIMLWTLEGPIMAQSIYSGSGVGREIAIVCT